MIRGTSDDKIHFVFNMYDVSHDNTVSKQELSTLLNHIPKEAFTHYYDVQYTPTNASAAAAAGGVNPPLPQQGQYVRGNSNTMFPSGIAVRLGAQLQSRRCG